VVCFFFLEWKKQTDIPEAKKQNENDSSLQAMAQSVAARQTLLSLLRPLSIPVTYTGHTQKGCLISTFQNGPQEKAQAGREKKLAQQ